MIIKPDIHTPVADRAARYDGTPKPPERFCGTKKQFAVEVRAINAARKLAKVTGEPWEWYRCEHHRCWHIGHPKGWRKKTGAEPPKPGDNPVDRYRRPPSGDQ